jgi:hypothetical protein
MSEEDKEHFLSRWSRRKLGTGQTEGEAMQEPEPSSIPALPAAVPQGVAPSAPAELPSIESLQGIASEYKDFFKPGVDDALKRAALKKLFNDPHFRFANMDKLDTYIDDYSIEDPIPEAMLRSLNQAKSLFLFEDEKKEDEKLEQAAAPATQQPALPPQSDAADVEISAIEPKSEPARTKPA